MTTRDHTRIGVLTATLIILVAAVTVIAATAIADQGDTTRVSVESSGNEGNDVSSSPSVSATGRYVAFYSAASNLVANDTNNAFDVFVHDRDTGATERVSVNDTGNQGNHDSTLPSVSADGRFISFESDASNLVPNDTNASDDVFIHDRDTGITARVSVDGTGNQGNNISIRPSISANGRYVAFDSAASNLVANDTNNAFDVFIHDRDTGVTERVSVDGTGNQGDTASLLPSVSANGRFIAFHSGASNLVANDTNNARDVFVHDRDTGVTERVSVDSTGNQGNNSSIFSSMSANGRYVAFESFASNLVANDNNNAFDVFVHDRDTGVTERVSIDGTGNQGNTNSFRPSVSANGRYVAFHSDASNLIAGDTNNVRDVFVHDRDMGNTTRVSVNSNGNQGNNASALPSVSADGRYIGFDSDATNLVSGDTASATDVFVHQYLPDPPPPTTTTTTSTTTTSSTTTSTTTTTMPPGETDFFTDDDGHLFEEDINAIAEAGITRGCNPPVNDHYCPDESFLRGQAAAFLRRALDVPASETDHFTDDDNSVFEEDINAIAEAGITLGCNPPDNTLFCPEDPFTRGQAAAFVRRALNVPASDTDHFVDDNDSVFEEDINAIAEAGITRGCNPPDNNRYCPDDLLTRGQAAAFMRRALLP